MRSLFGSACLAAALCASALSACDTFPAQVDALKPRDARSAYAEAEILFIGVLNTSDILAARGIISGEQVGDMLPAFGSIAQALDDAFKLLKAGETVAALAKVDFAHADLMRLADALSRANEAATVFLPSPASWHPVTI